MPNPTNTFRLKCSDNTDIDTITEIYNEAILTTTSTFDLEPRSVEERRRWLEDRSERHPVLVATLNNMVVGWSSLSPWKERAAYNDTAETSFYVKAEHRGKGIGRKLKAAIIDEARRLGFHTLIAGCAEGSDASMHLNEAYGFERVGTFRDVGLKFGKRLDVTYFQLALSERNVTIQPEVGTPANQTGSVETSFLLSAKENLESSAAKIRHCVDQLNDEQLWWRPTPSQNSIGNLILHLCGNVGQWIICGVGGAEDMRDRPREFANDKRHRKAELSAMLNACVAQARRTLETTPASAVMSGRRIQGYDTTVLSAVLDSVSHFQGHTQEIISLTRQQLGDRYTFDFIPTTPEQISSKSGE